jgi:hypothetical protein
MTGRAVRAVCCCYTSLGCVRGLNAKEEEEEGGVSRRKGKGNGRVFRKTKKILYPECGRREERGVRGEGGGGGGVQSN